MFKNFKALITGLKLFQGLTNPLYAQSNENHLRKQSNLTEIDTIPDLPMPVWCGHKKNQPER